MKINELMIGDWVNYRGIYNRIAPADFCHSEWIDEIKPIPLTPEILERNEFEYKDSETGMFGIEIVPYYLRNDIPFKIFCDGEPFAIWFDEPINIKYVHQLQHTLRLCGIEKEIEL